MNKEREDEIRTMYRDYGFAYRPTGDTIGELIAALDECRAELAATKLARSQPDHYTVELVSLRKERDALQVQLDECRAERDKLKAYVDPVTEQAVTMKEERDGLRLACREMVEAIELGTCEIPNLCDHDYCGTLWETLTSTRELLSDAGVSLE